MPCPHCTQNNNYMEGRLLRCICGYWNDIDRPLRTKTDQVQIDIIDKQELMAEVNLLRPDYETTRWHDKPSVDDEEVARKKRESQLKYRAAHKDEINQRRRERAKETRSLNAIRRVQA